MLEFYVKSDVKLRQLRQSPAGTHLDALAGWLRSAGYRQRPAQLALRGAAHLSHWAKARGLPTARLGEGILDAFVGHLSTCVCPHPFRGRDSYHAPGARRLVEYLQDTGVVAPTGATPQRLPPLAQGFASWMRQHRGVTPSTLANYLPLVNECLTALGEDAAQYDAGRVRAFVLARASRHGHSRAKSVVNAVRMFLRFLAAYGHCPAALIAAVPTVAAWRLSSLPRYIGSDDVERLIATCDPTHAAGARDRAVMLLLARLGLRAGDVRALRLAHIDWSHGRFRVIGKGRCETWLPLPQDVGDAIVHYVEHFRPASGDDHIFLRVYAPRGPLPSSGAISKLVRRGIQRAGIKAPSMGAHLLRHSAATDMLRQGSSLDVIGAVLRHRCIESTAHYAKVHVSLLRAVAQPWPVDGGAPC